MNSKLANINGVYHSRESWMAIWESQAKTMTKATVVREVTLSRPEATIQAIADAAKCSISYAYTIGNTVRKLVS